jgi:hypothetical protein
MLIVAMVLVPAILLAAGARARNSRAGWLLVGAGLLVLVFELVLASLALPIGGGVEGGTTP